MESSTTSSISGTIQSLSLLACRLVAQGSPKRSSGLTLQIDDGQKHKKTLCLLYMLSKQNVLVSGKFYLEHSIWR